MLLIDVLGWVDLRRAAVLRLRLGAGQPALRPRRASISVALSLVTFYGFYLGLGIALPAGILEGML